MEVEENDFQVESKPLTALASAFNELEMLATGAGIKTKKYLNMLTINTRYVSNVSIGFRVKPSSRRRVPYKPYNVPQKERHRTRSENNDIDAASSLANKIVEDCITQSITEISQLKKAKSLESLVAEGGENKELKTIKFGSHNELELMSDGVQKLRVVE